MVQSLSHDETSIITDTGIVVYMYVCVLVVMCLLCECTCINNVHIL